jgi:hypothetical protein
VTEVVYASGPVVSLVLPLLFVIFTRLAAIQVDDLEQVLGEAVLRSLEGARLTVKEAAAIMKIDESQLRHGLRGEKGYHLSLNRLARLPFVFWLHFSPALVYLVAKRNASDIAEDLGLKRSA